MQSYTQPINEYSQRNDDYSIDEQDRYACNQMLAVMYIINQCIESRLQHLAAL